MNCKDVISLISPYIDGELNGSSADEVKMHIEACPGCRQTYVEYLQISSLFKAVGKNITPAPDGFKDSVMQRLMENQKVVSLPLGRRLSRSWKQIAASAAAVAILAFSGFNYLLPAAVQLAENNKPGTVITEPQDKQNTADPGDKISNPGSDTTSSDAVDPAGSDTSETPRTNIPENITSDTTPGTQSDSTPVLLSPEQQSISRIMVKISTGDFCPNPYEKAIAIAEDCGAKYESLGQQVTNDTTYRLIEMTTSRKSAPALINKLANLGSIVSQEEDLTDISTAYTDAYNEYLNLVTQYSYEKDPVEKAKLEQKINNIANQLGEFKQQAEQATIVVWLEE